MVVDLKWLNTRCAELQLELNFTGITLLPKTIGSADIWESEKALQDVITWLLEANFHAFPVKECI